MCYRSSLRRTFCKFVHRLPRCTSVKSNKIKINQLCLTRVTLNSLTTDKPVALGFQIKLEFGNVGFGGEEKTGEPGEKPLRARTRTNNKLNPHDTESRNRTRTTLVGGECSHHCAIPAPPKSLQFAHTTLSKAQQRTKMCLLQLGICSFISQFVKVPEYGGQFCSSSSSPPASVRELEDAPLRLRTSTFPRRLKGLVTEN